MADYKWTFENVGGATRVRIQNGEDIRHLGELDQKMWTVLSCPISGLEIDADSLSLMDIDKDGQLRLKEVVATANWLCSVLKDPEELFSQSDTIALEDIADEAIYAVASQLSDDTQKVSLAVVNAAIDAVTIEPTSIPAAPYEADIVATYKEKKAEIAAYFEATKMQKMGLLTIPEEVAAPLIKEKDFVEMGKQIADYETALAAASAADTEALSIAKIQYADLRKLLIIKRDFCQLLRNFITLEDFYTRDKATMAIFQAGVLVIDQRACRLCVRVNDMAKHNMQAGASGMFLVYCDCVSKKLGKNMQIVAGITIGEIKNLTVGKNAIFYDRQGNDYDATIIKIIDNPISIRQAFWSPYRKFGNWVTDLINKSAAEKDSKAFADVTTKVQEKTTEPVADMKKQQAFDIAKFAGIFAAIGMAIGFIGSFLTSVVEGAAALTWWQLIVAVVAILLVISGPAMVMAWLKLRSRNLAPILNANGWAVNADTLISVPFGATLTEQVQFPLLKLTDPFAKRGMPIWKKWLIWIAIVLMVVGACVWAAWVCGIGPFEQAEVVEHAAEEIEILMDSAAFAE